jgi:hypothetical protein
MPHQVELTIVAPVTDGHAEELQQHLQDLGEKPAALPFGEFANLHFARFFVLQETHDLAGQAIPAMLIFLSDVDGPAEPYLAALVETFGGMLDDIFRHCVAYPTGDSLTTENRLAFLRSRTVSAATAYVNTVGRSVQQIRQEAGLREAIEDYLDQSEGELSGRSATEIRSAIRDFVFGERSLRWARRPAPPPELWWRVREILHAILLPVTLLLLLPLVLVGGIVWLVLIRLHERLETPARDVTAPASLEALTAIEDHVVQNPFTLLGFVKPGAFRGRTLQIILGLASYAVRHIYNHGRLIGIGTIHFARWVFIDGKRRMFFASNYDGSRESYMDDFIDRLSWGLNAVGSNGVGYPKTRWLVWQGAKDEEAYKRFLRRHQVPTQIWYSAYPDLSTANIENNARIRAGLYGGMTSKKAQEWLRRL